MGGGACLRVPGHTRPVAIQAGKFTTKEPDFSNAYLNEFFLLLETGNYYFIKNATESKVYTIQDMNALTNHVPTRTYL